MFYLTTSRPYTNSTPHLGTAMDAVYADCLNRFLKRLGQQTFFSMGTDEHSFKIVDKAKELGVTPKQFVDAKFLEFESFYNQLDLSFDENLQSSNPKHYWVANLIWERLLIKNLIYKKTYQGLYCIGCEDFYSESQLIGGHCPIHPHLEIQKVSEENYFFKLAAFKEQVLEYLDRVTINDPSVRVEMKNFAKDLQDISVSRDRSRLSVDWGIPVNSDPSHLMYVWFEALQTYLTPLIPDELYENWLEGSPDIQKTIELEVWEIWAEELPQNLQIIGRDNAKFHLIIWPATLFALGLRPIESLLVHGMINDKFGRKFAKSAGNGITLEDTLSQFGKDGTRFIILHELNSIGDTNLDIDRVIESYNANLANNLGNLVVRVTNLVEKMLGGLINFDPIDIKVPAAMKLEINTNEVYKELEDLAPEKAFRILITQATLINQYLEKHKPWELAKDADKNEAKIKTVLTVAAINLKTIAETLSIFLPDSGGQIYEILTASKIIKAPAIFPRIEVDAES